MFNENFNWKTTILKPLLMITVLSVLVFCGYFVLYSIFGSLSSLIPKNLRSTDISNATNAFFSALIVAIISCCFNLLPQVGEKQLDRKKKITFSLYILKNRLEILKKDVSNIQVLLLDSNISDDTLQEQVKNKIDDIEKKNEEIVRISIETEFNDLPNKVVSFFEMVKSNKSFSSKNDILSMIVDLNNKIDAVVEIVNTELENKLKY
ncbi:hypothetical protein [Bacillus cereus group sp. BfR-BA-01382]|uniref:hypothetical protein n=1 Tax=Bacillus cereus group sp. BfR-BA-01382 TaxID=2920326 RepID=UPI001F59402B